MTIYESLSLLISVAGSIGVILSLLLNRQTGIFSRQLRESLSQSMTNYTLEISRLFLEHPDLRPYFFEGQLIDESHYDYLRAEALAEVILDIFWTMMTASKHIQENEFADEEARSQWVCERLLCCKPAFDQFLDEAQSVVWSRNDAPYGARAGPGASASVMNDSANAPSAAYRFQHLTAFPPDAVRQIEAIYEVSFPPKERKPFWLVADAMQSGRYSVFTVSQDGEASSEIVAFALLLRMRTSQAMYIEYRAVALALRNRGIGSLLLRSVIEFLKNTAAPAIVWEVEPPDQPGDDRVRRIQFYERGGAYLIEQSKPYAMPNYRAGSGTLPLRIMWKPLDHDRTQPTKSELIAFIRDIYETEYHGQEAVRDEIIANLDNP